MGGAAVGRLPKVLSLTRRSKLTKRGKFTRRCKLTRGSNGLTRLVHQSIAKAAQLLAGSSGGISGPWKEMTSCLAPRS